MLATEATTLLHGRAAADEAAETARKTFEEGALAESLPTVEIERASLEAGQGLLSLFVSAGFAASNGEARRHVQGGAVRVNDEPVKDERRVIGLCRCRPRRCDQAVARPKEARARAGLFSPTCGQCD